MRKMLMASLVLGTLVSTTAFAGDRGTTLVQQPTRMPCHDAIEIAKVLSKKYGESPVAFGVQSNGNLLQVYASKDGRTWSVVVTSPSGTSCIVAAGENWEKAPPNINDPVA